jgi:hypothetical protein
MECEEKILLLHAAQKGPESAETFSHLLQGLFSGIEWTSPFDTNSILV